MNVQEKAPPRHEKSTSASARSAQDAAAGDPIQYAGGAGSIGLRRIQAADKPLARAGSIIPSLASRTVQPVIVATEAAC